MLTEKEKSLKQERLLRLIQCNELLETIASCGRKFFNHGDRVAEFEIDERGRIWFIDEFTQKRIYTHYSGDWRGFTNGGTMKHLIERLRDYISTGTTLKKGHFGPWPEWYGGGDPWEYGDDMRLVRDKVAALKIEDE